MRVYATLASREAGRIARVVGAVLVFVTVLATPSRAAPQLIATDPGDAGLVRATPDGAAWITGRWTSAGDVVTYFLRRGHIGAGAVDLARVGSFSIEADLPRGTTVQDLLTGAGHALARVSHISGYARGFTSTYESFLNAGDLSGGARRTILSCDGSLGSDLAGTLLVSACAVGDRPTPGPVELRDLAAPATPPVQVAPAGIDPKVAGTMVGWRTGTTDETIIIVRDTARDIEVQRIPTTAVSAWALQGDGKVAFVRQGTSGAYTVSWAIPGDPAIRSFDSPLRVSGLRLRNDQLVFERVGVETELALRPLAGPERVVARYAPTSLVSFAPVGTTFDFDFDGSGLLLARMRCGRSEVVRHSLGAPADSQRVDLCPLLPATETAKVDRRGRASMDVTCPRLVPQIWGDSCRVKATLRLRGRRLATATKIVRAGEWGALRFSLATRLRRTRPGRLSVRLESRMRGGTDRRTVIVRPAYPTRRSRGT